MIRRTRTKPETRRFQRSDRLETNLTSCFHRAIQYSSRSLLTVSRWYIHISVMSIDRYFFFAPSPCENPPVEFSFTVKKYERVWKKFPPFFLFLSSIHTRRSISITSRNEIRNINPRYSIVRPPLSIIHTRIYKHIRTYKYIHNMVEHYKRR